LRNDVLGTGQPARLVALQQRLINAPNVTCARPPLAARRSYTYWPGSFPSGHAMSMSEAVVRPGNGLCRTAGPGPGCLQDREAEALQVGKNGLTRHPGFTCFPAKASPRTGRAMTGQPGRGPLTKCGLVQPRCERKCTAKNFDALSQTECLRTPVRFRFREPGTACIEPPRFPSHFESKQYLSIQDERWVTLKNAGGKRSFGKRIFAASKNSIVAQRMRSDGIPSALRSDIGCLKR
jgi:hypothetical protein